VASWGRNPENPSSRITGDPTEQRFEAHEDGKTNTLTSVSKDNLIAEPETALHDKMYTLDAHYGKAPGVYNPHSQHSYSRHAVAVPQEKPAKDQKVYTVADGQIEVNGKCYPIKLKDGKYIIRKLTVTECMRLQTVPEWYDFGCVSNTQAYKMLGNGWTVEVIAHLIRGAIQSAS
jgi:site-specific DNA-cytosine methylase